MGGIQWLVIGILAYQPFLITTSTLLIAGYWHVKPFWAITFLDIACSLWTLMDIMSRDVSTLNIIIWQSTTVGAPLCIWRLPHNQYQSLATVFGNWDCPWHQSYQPLPIFIIHLLTMQFESFLLPWHLCICLRRRQTTVGLCVLALAVTGRKCRRVSRKRVSVVSRWEKQDRGYVWLHQFLYLSVILLTGSQWS